MTIFLKEIHKDDWKRYLINYLLSGGNKTGMEKKLVKNYTTKAINFMRDFPGVRKVGIAKLTIETKDMEISIE